MFTQLVFEHFRGFFQLARAKAAAPILTLNMSKGKDVPFVDPEYQIIHFDPIFPLKWKPMIFDSKEASAQTTS